VTINGEGGCRTHVIAIKVTSSTTTDVGLFQQQRPPTASDGHPRWLSGNRRKASGQVQSRKAGFNAIQRRRKIAVGEFYLDPSRCALINERSGDGEGRSCDGGIRQIVAAPRRTIHSAHPPPLPLSVACNKTRDRTTPLERWRRREYKLRRIFGFQDKCTNTLAQCQIDYIYILRTQINCSQFNTLSSYQY